MRSPKKAKKTLNYYLEVVDVLRYYMPEMPKEFSDKVKFIRESIEDLAVEQKLHDIRLATKLKKFWKSENE